MNSRQWVMAAGVLMVLSARPAFGQSLPLAPGTPPDLDRRVFVDVNRVTPGRVLDQLCGAIACTLDVDRKLPQPDISLRLSNVRARTALDAVCDTVGCRWSLKGRTLVVMATATPPAVPKGQQWVERMKTPLTGDTWKLERVPLGDVLASLSRELGAEVVFEGADLGAPVTDDLRGRTYLDAFDRVFSAAGCKADGGMMASGSAAGPQEVRFNCRNERGTVRDAPAARPDRPYQKGDRGLTMPRVISEVRPYYTREAMQAKVQGSVSLSAVVEADGTVGEVKVLRSLDPNLDAQAIRAARQWRFEPGTKDGKPVPVQVTLDMTFTLK